MDELAIIVKHSDGSACTTKIDLFRGLTRMVTGCAVGGFFGLPGGGIIGAVGRQEHSFDKEFVNDIRHGLTPGKAAVIAEVTEESEPSVDNRMAELGGVVFRWTKDRVKTGENKQRSDHLDELLDVKINDAIASSGSQARMRALDSLDRAGGRRGQKKEP